jgi:hypothetical protein
MNGAAIVGKSKRVRLDQPAYYRVYLQGILDASWSAELQGMNFHLAAPAHAPAMTVLSGELVDQAALMSVLSLIYDLGLPLMAVECLPYAETWVRPAESDCILSADCADCADCAD